MTLRSIPALLAIALVVPALGALVPVAEAAPSVQQVTIASFDGTPLAATLFVPGGLSEDERVPYVLMTHGWAGSRTASATGRVADLLDAGYGVLTWDSRGFGASGGQVMLDSPQYEVKDVSRLIDWLVVNAPVQMDAPNDPRVGMNGVSYAGTIQLLSAAFDERIDVITPEIAWNDLSRSLAPGGVPKLSWVNLLFGGGLGTSCQQGHDLAKAKHGCQTELLALWYTQTMALGRLPSNVENELRLRSPQTYIDRIDVPTLLVQGFPDTLFDVDEAVANYNGIKANGAPVKLWLYDGGHVLPWEGGSCGTQCGKISAVVINWLDCHLKAVAGCDTGPEVEYYSPDGVWRSAPSWPVPQTPRNIGIAGHIVPGGADGAAAGLGVVTLETATVPMLATGGARALVSTVEAGEGALFFALGVRKADGDVVRVGEQQSPVRLGNGVGFGLYAVDLVDVSVALGPGDSLVLLVQFADADFAPQRGTPAVIYNLLVDWQSGSA